jgi:acrylyl-CoA reductase (NADPH)
MDNCNFSAIVVREGDNNTFTSAVETRNIADLPAGDVLIRVSYSSLNFKDALSFSGVRRVTKTYPHTPGIDAAGNVVESNDARFAPGDAVLVTGFDLGMNTPGGLAQYIRVPADWVTPRPQGLDARTAMIFGTAGLTVALSIRELEAHGVLPGRGPVLVTGATGGVGSLGVAILAHAGYEVVAVTGKQRYEQALIDLGAAAVISRETLLEGAANPLNTETWQGALDSVGGAVLASVAKAMRYGGCITCCGWTGGIDVPLTMHPFMLRAVKLIGIDSVSCPEPQRAAAWHRLAGEWRGDEHGLFVSECGLGGVAADIERMLQRESVGRHIVSCNDI